MALEALQEQKDSEIGNFYANSMSIHVPSTTHYDDAMNTLKKLLVNSEIVE